VQTELIVPDWPVPARVRALVTTRALGDMKSTEGRARLRQYLPSEPKWFKQVHGISVVDAATAGTGVAADASFTREEGVVCTAMAADCMPVLLAHDGGEVVGIAHAGWRGLCAGVIEATVAAMGAPAGRVIAWLGPAIGPDAYEIGEEVRAAFLQHDAHAAGAFRPTRPGHWHLDLYAIARQRLAAQGVARVSGGGFCTASDSSRFFSYRRDKASERMAAAVWLVP
jgi:polyphenol oxidase